MTRPATLARLTDDDGKIGDGGAEMPPAAKVLSETTMPAIFPASPEAAGMGVADIGVADIGVAESPEIQHDREVIEALLDHSENPLAYLDASFNFVRVNRAYAEAGRRRPEDFVGQNHFYFYPHPENEAIFARARDSGEPAVWREKPFVFPGMPDRGLTYWDWTLTPLRGATGLVEGLVLSLQDVTDRVLARRAVEALRKSEELNRRVIESSPDCIKVLDLDGRLLSMSAGGQRLLEIEDLEPYLQTRWSDFWQGAEREAAAMAVARARAGETARFEGYCPTARGSPRWWEVSISPIRDARGEPEQLVAISRDVTNRKRAEERFRVLSEAMPQIVWSADPSGAVDYFNQQALEYSGAKREDLTGSQWESIVHPDDLGTSRRRWRRSLQSGEAYVTEQRLRRADGEYHWHLTRGVPIRDEAGRITRWIGTGTDIHDQKQAERALREADRRKDEFLALLAHELRNPLAPILSSVEVIRRSGKDAQRERAEAIIQKQVRHMARLIDDLLDVSRIGQGKISLDRELISLADVVDNAVETSQPLVDAGGHRLSVSLPAQPIRLLADRVRLAQVLSNVINNAAKYSPPGGLINISATVDEHGVTIDVSDRGIGIKPEILPHVFDLFVQGDTALQRERGGLGVGLALARSLVELHGGSIEALSAGPGLGAEIVIRLPLAPAPRETGRDAASADGAAVKKARFRVLVVDDSPDVTESMSTLLELLGHEVRSASDGIAALELAESFHPDIVLLDIGMPQMTGHEVARRLRAAGQRALLIAMTGWGQEEDRRQTRAAGFDHHLTKPAEIDDLERLFQKLAAGTEEEQPPSR